MLLGELAEIIFSFPERGEDRGKWLSAISLQEDNYIGEIKDEFELKTNPIYKICKGDILVKRIQPQYVNYISDNIDAYVGVNLIIIRAKENIDKKYLAYLLETNLNKLYVDTSRSVLSAINRKSFEELNFAELPSIAKQKAIGELWWLAKEKKKLYKDLCLKEQIALKYNLSKIQ